MPWTAEVNLYPDGESEQRVIAILIWDEGGPDEFRYTEPKAEVTVAAAEEFVTAATDARNVAATRRQKETQLAQQLANIANA